MNFKFLFATGILGASLGMASSRAGADISTTIQVSAKNFMFLPATLTIKTGTTITWVNLDDEPHTVFSDSGLFRSSALDTKDSFSFKFEKPGTYHYSCTIHPRMLGTIVVE